MPVSESDDEKDERTSVPRMELLSPFLHFILLSQHKKILKEDKRGRKMDPFKVSHYSHTVTFHPERQLASFVAPVIRHRNALQPPQTENLQNGEGSQQQKERKTNKRKVDYLLGNPSRFVIKEEVAPFFSKLN